MQRIYFDDFLLRLYGLTNGSYLEKNQFAFWIYDFDNNGIISAADIVKLNEEIFSKTCHGN